MKRENAIKKKHDILFYHSNKLWHNKKFILQHTITIFTNAWNWFSKILYFLSSIIICNWYKWEWNIAKLRTEDKYAMKLPINLLPIKKPASLWKKFNELFRLDIPVLMYYRLCVILLLHHLQKLVIFRYYGSLKINCFLCLMPMSGRVVIFPNDHRIIFYIKFTVYDIKYTLHIHIF